MITYPNGDILVAEGHGGPNSRLIKFDKTGKFIKQFGKRAPASRASSISRTAWRSTRRAGCSWPIAPTTASRFSTPQTFKTLDTWYQFSRLSGIFIKDDIIYGADSESGSVNPPHYAWKRGIRIGSARDGKVTAFIPDPSHDGADLRDGRRQGRR